MSLIKKIDVEKHFAARRAMRLGRIGLLSQQGARTDPAITAKRAPAPVKNDAMGYSSMNASAAPTPTAVDSGGTRESTEPRNRQT